MEILSEDIAFEIIRQVNFLAQYPEMGAPLEIRFPRLQELRQIVIKRNWRVVYDFEAEKETVFIVAVQNCRQKLLPIRDLKRRKHRID